MVSGVCESALTAGTAPRAFAGIVAADPRAVPEGTCGKSRCRCGRIPVQMWASPGADVGKSRCRCGQVSVQMWASPGADAAGKGAYWFSTFAPAVENVLLRKRPVAASNTCIVSATDSGHTMDTCHAKHTPVCPPDGHVGVRVLSVNECLHCLARTLSG